MALWKSLRLQELEKEELIGAVKLVHRLLKVFRSARQNSYLQFGGRDRNAVDDFD